MLCHPICEIVSSETDSKDNVCCYFHCRPIIADLMWLQKVPAKSLAAWLVGIFMYNYYFGCKLRRNIAHQARLCSSSVAISFVKKWIRSPIIHKGFFQLRDIFDFKKDTPPTLALLQQQQVEFSPDHFICKAALEKSVLFSLDLFILFFLSYVLEQVAPNRSDIL